MAHEKFTELTKLAYISLLKEVPAESIARIWNFIPGINDILDDQLDRYMAFNGGRFLMYCEELDEHLGHPAASGVGHSGADLVLHVLYGVREVRGVDNLRQKAPSRYSDKFGPRPPAFSRASLVSSNDGWWLLVSGTASVVGEESVHEDDLQRQISETMHNLESIREATTAVFGSEVSYGSGAQWRIYMPCTNDIEGVAEALVREHGAVVGNLEFRKQALCRPELLVEIECAVRVGATA
jgi:chorismate lyase/3-hydroxybenzoate synthase